MTNKPLLTAQNNYKQFKSEFLNENIEHIDNAVSSILEKINKSAESGYRYVNIWVEHYFPKKFLIFNVLSEKEQELFENEVISKLEKYNFKITFYQGRSAKARCSWRYHEISW